MEATTILEVLTPIASASVGQIPGQTYAARVYDSNGNPLKAGFFFMDSNSKPITQDFLTDDQGMFHYTIPDTNEENIFVQFYSYDGYAPVVKTFDELVAHPSVILTKDSKQLPGVAILSIAAIGLTVLTTHNGKKMGTTYIERFKSQSTSQKLLLVGGIGLGAYLLYEAIFKAKPTPQQAQELAEAKTMLQALAAEKGIVPSLPNAQYPALANQIIAAVDDCGTDEQTIYRVFSTLNNEADIYKLIIAFGVGSYKGCFEGHYFGNVHYTLSQAMAADLSESEIDNVNHTLFNKGIKYRF